MSTGATTRSTRSSSRIIKSRDELDLMTREELISYSVSVNELVCEKLLGLEERIETLESESVVQRNTNELLKLRADRLEGQVVELEKTATNSAQYLRRRQIEVSDVPEAIKDEHLKDRMSSFLSITGVDVTADDIEVCHRLKNKTVVIMEFGSRSLRDSVLISRGKLKDKGQHMKEVGLQNSYINDSMCNEYRRLAFICRQLKRKQIVKDTWFFNGKLYVLGFTNKKCLIRHLHDLYDIAGADTVQTILQKSK